MLFFWEYIYIFGGGGVSYCYLGPCIQKVVCIPVVPNISNPLRKLDPAYPETHVLLSAVPMNGSTVSVTCLMW